MIIKTFRAETSAAALKLVKMEMGGDAIVLKTTQSKDAGYRTVFEVTACLENPTVSQSSALLESPSNKIQKETNRVTVEEQPELKIRNDETPYGEPDNIDNKIAQRLNSADKNDHGVLQDIYDKLHDADFDSGYLDGFVSSLNEEYDGHSDPDQYVIEKLTEEFDKIKADPIEFKGGDRITLLGPAGCGKSSVTGKIAASLVSEAKQKVKLVSLDDFKMAAHDEIAAYAEILGVDLSDIDSDNENDLSDVITLIDSPATPIEKEQSERLIEKIEAVNPNYRLIVLSALIRSRDIKYFTGILSDYKPTHLVITKTDLTQSYGAIMTAAETSGLKVLYLSNSSGGIGKLECLDSKMLSEKLLAAEVECE